MNRKQKLELTWIGKENRPRLEPRILLEDPEKSYHASHRVTDVSPENDSASKLEYDGDFDGPRRKEWIDEAVTIL